MKNSIEGVFFSNNYGLLAATSLKDELLSSYSSIVLSAIGENLL